MKFFALTLLSLYRLVLSPWLGNACRFHPTCSAYAQEAIERHGTFKGGCLALRRLLACHPYSRRRGLDPVPDRFTLRGLIGYTQSCEPNP